MSFAYLTLYTGDYLRDTRHLSCAEHGIYLLLLMHCWDSRGPVPLDERKIAGICGARSGDEVEAMRRILAEFFTRMDDGWYQPRMQREIERAQAISADRQRAAFTRHKGRDASAMQVQSKSNALDTNTNTTITTNTTPNTTTAASDTKVVCKDDRAQSTQKPRGSRLTVETLPQEWHAFCAKERDDLDPLKTFDHFRDYWIAVAGAKGNKLDWFATWRNWVRNQGSQRNAGKSLTDRNKDAMNQWLNQTKGSAEREIN